MTENAKGKISPLAAWALSFGCAVGWGSFVMPGTIFLPKAGPLGTVLGVVVGGLIMAVIAWNYHVMMNRHPGPGGAYAYASAAFGIDHAFLCAWFLVLAYVAIVWANATALAIVARYTLGDIFSFGFRYTFAGFEVCLGDILLSGVAIIIAAAICVRRRLACAVNAVFAVGFGLGIVVCFAAVAAKHAGGVAAAGPAFAPGGPNQVAQVLKTVSLSPWLFVGFEGISHSSGEFSFPRKRSFAIMAASLVASVLAYSFLALLPALMHSGSGEAWPEYLARLFGEGGGVAIPTFDTVKNAIGRVGVAVMGVTMFGAIFTGLVGNTFAILANLGTMLRRREHALMRDKVRHRRERDQEREKSRARSYFFSTVSHDIRTPLNAIIGFSEMLKDPSQSEAEREQAVDSILVSGKTLLALINDVLDLSKLESGRMEILPEPTDCPKLLHDVMEAFRVAKGKTGVELRCKADVEVKSRFAEMGFDDILLKPITFAMLDAVLKGNL